MLVAFIDYMKQFDKEILKEALTICRQSSLYYVFTAKEKREAIMHVYDIIDKTSILKRHASRRTA